MPFYFYILATSAALIAGFINAIAGGGTLLTFPLLLGMGIAPIVANVTNTIALVPGVLGGLWAQKREFIDQKKRIFQLLIVSVPGGIFGGYLLLTTNNQVFSTLVPYLILTATFLLIYQNKIKTLLAKRKKSSHITIVRKAIVAILIFIAAVYGGYFGAGLGIILMAVLGLSFDNSLGSINVLKQAIAFAVNIAAAIFFMFSDKIIYSLAFPMIVAAIAGGYLGGRFVNKVNPQILRYIIILTGLSVGTYYLLKQL